jgi:hypothetical protein
VRLARLSEFLLDEASDLIWFFASPATLAFAALPLGLSLHRGPTGIDFLRALLSQPFTPLQSVSTLGPLPWLLFSEAHSNCLPCGFFPFGVFPTASSSTGSTIRRPLPPQRFARSRGFSPPAVCRPYFMPVPPMGFLPEGQYPRAKLFTLSGFSTLLWLAQKASQSFSSSQLPSSP